MKDITPKKSEIEAKTSRLAATASINLIGYAAIVVFFIGFGYWAVSAPIAGAAIASGRIAAAGDNQTIQHLEGGIISQIHIREGDRIERGAPMLTLDDTQVKSTMQRLSRQKVSLDARLARLSAERDLADSFDYDSGLIMRAKALSMQDVLAEQRQEFQTRILRQQSEDRILHQRIAAQRDALEGFYAQKNALEEQIAVVKDESARKLKLLDQGLTNRSEYTQLVRAQADLVGRLGSMTAEIARAKNQIIESEEQIERQRTTTAETAIREINELRIELADIEERINSGRDILERVVIRAPADGLVIDIAKNAVGSVVRPGEDLATILPTSQELLVSARLSIIDIDNVRPGQGAQLRLSALNLRRTPEVPGEVIFVSPDRLLDQKTQEPYYEARLRILDLPDEIDADQIYPGMPVEALISTQERTFGDYLLRPILDSMSLAFREG